MCYQMLKNKINLDFRFEIGFRVFMFYLFKFKNFGKF